jgi:hypothetical protein
MKQRTKRWLTVSLVALAAIWFCFLGFIGWAMRQPPEVFGRAMSRMPMPAFFLFPFETMWTQARKGHLNVGDAAPDFTVKTLETKTPVALSSLWTTKPVVLVFGSYT